MDVGRALSQIAEIHQQIAKGEVYRGYRSLPIAASGVIGLVAAVLQPRYVRGPRSVGFVLYWTLVAAVRSGRRNERNRLQLRAHEDEADRRRTRKVLGQFLPSVVAGGGHHRELYPPERGAGAAAAGPLGDLLRHRRVRVAALSSARERLGGAVLLRRGHRAPLACERSGKPERLVGRRHVWRWASCWRRWSCTGISSGTTNSTRTEAGGWPAARQSNDDEEEKNRRERPIGTLRLRRPRPGASRKGAPRHHDVARDATRGLLFGELKRLCSLTDGNLSRHLDVLHEAGSRRGLEGVREPPSADALPPVDGGPSAFRRVSRGARASDSRRDAEGGAAQRASAGDAARVAAGVTPSRSAELYPRVTTPG